MMKGLVCEAGAIIEQTLPSHFAGTAESEPEGLKKKREKLPAKSTTCRRGSRARATVRETRAPEDNLQESIWETKFKSNNY